VGGAKKKSISQMEKVKPKEDEKPTKKKSAKPVTEKKSSGINLPDVKDKALISELEKMKAITPVAIASTYGVRVSVAKDFLEELVKKQLIRLIESCNRIKIYKLTGTT